MYVSASADRADMIKRRLINIDIEKAEYMSEKAVCSGRWQLRATAFLIKNCRWYQFCVAECLSKSLFV